MADAMTGNEICRGQLVDVKWFLILHLASAMVSVTVDLHVRRSA